MDTEAFFTSYKDIYRSFGTDRQEPKDVIFSALIADIGSMSCPNITALLNLACNLLPEDEIYCEIGCWQGGTLISALWGNKAKAVAVDNFSQFEGKEEKLRVNIMRYQMQKRIEFHNETYTEFFASEVPKIGVYFYDAIHDYAPELEGLRACISQLSDRALIFVDDTAMGGVQQALAEFEKEIAIGRTIEFPSPKNGDPRWWDGLKVLEFIRE